MLRTSLIVLASSVTITALALSMLTFGSGFSSTLVWALWSLWGVAAVGGGAVYLVARRADRM